MNKQEWNPDLLPILQAESLELNGTEQLRL